MVKAHKPVAVPHALEQVPGFAVLAMVNCVELKTDATMKAPLYAAFDAPVIAPLFPTANL